MCEFIDQLQGFEIELRGDRYEPYEVIVREVSALPRDKDRISKTVELANKLVEVFSSQVDRKLRISSYDWPSPEQEPIRLPERLLFNALRLAAALQVPELLGDAICKLLERERAEPLFNGELRSVLLDAMQANQRGAEYFSLWCEIAEQGSSKDQYFLSNPEFGRQGTLRASEHELSAALAGVNISGSELARRQVADALKWLGMRYRVQPMTRKAKFRNELYALLSEPLSSATHLLLVQLADLARWPEWMCRQLPPVMPIYPNEYRQSYIVKEEVYACIPIEYAVTHQRDLCQGSFIELICESSVDALRFRDLLSKEADAYGDITKANLNSSDSAETGCILEFLQSMCESPAFASASARIDTLRRSKVADLVGSPKLQLPEICEEEGPTPANIAAVLAMSKVYDDKPTLPVSFAARSPEWIVTRLQRYAMTI